MAFFFFFGGGRIKQYKTIYGIFYFFFLDFLIFLKVFHFGSSIVLCDVFLWVFSWGFRSFTPFLPSLQAFGNGMIATLFYILLWFMSEKCFRSIGSKIKCWKVFSRRVLFCFFDFLNDFQMPFQGSCSSSGVFCARICCFWSILWDSRTTPSKCSAVSGCSTVPIFTHRGLQRMLVYRNRVSLLLL